MELGGYQPRQARQVAKLLGGAAQRVHGIASVARQAAIDVDLRDTALAVKGLDHCETGHARECRRVDPHQRISARSPTADRPDPLDVKSGARRRLRVHLTARGIDLELQEPVSDLQQGSATILCGHHVFEERLRNRQDDNRRRRHGRDQPREAAQQAHLADELSAVRDAHLALAPVDALHQPEASFADNVCGVARVALHEEHIIGLQHHALQLGRQPAKIRQLQVRKDTEPGEECELEAELNPLLENGTESGVRGGELREVTLIEPEHHQIARGSHGIREGRPQQRVLSERLALAQYGERAGFGSGTFLDEPGATAVHHVPRALRIRRLQHHVAEAKDEQREALRQPRQLGGRQRPERLLCSEDVLEVSDLHDLVPALWMRPRPDQPAKPPRGCAAGGAIASKNSRTRCR